MVTKYDKILFVAVVLAAVIIYFFSGLPASQPGDQVIVEASGEVIEKFPLADLEAGRQLPVAGPLGDTIVELGEGEVRIVSSPCPDKICVKMGWINRPGHVVVCLPNQVLVRIEGDTRSETDGVTR